MSATKMMLKPEQAMQDWQAIFPDFTTLEGSITFIKKLISTTLSTVTYFRGIFPERAYGERRLGGVRLKVLTEDSGCENVSKFIDLIRSCFDAVDKKYLQQLSVGICLDKERKDEVIEAYNLSFRYTDENFAVTCNNEKNRITLTASDPAVQATFLMLKHMLKISNQLGPLPISAHLTIKLLYYDDVTPPDYEPRGFESSITERFSFPTKYVKLNLGKVETKHSGFKFQLKSILALDENEHAEEPILQQRTCEETLPQQTHNQDSETKKKENPGNEVLEQKLYCPCKCSEVEDNEMIQCMFCEKKHHKICYGILEEAEVPTDFYCTRCFEFASDNLRATADHIYTSVGKEQQELCGMRRALFFISKNNVKSVTVQSLENIVGCSKEFSKTLIECLESEEIIKKGYRNKFMVNDKKCAFGMKKYFSSENKEDMEVEVKKPSSGKLSRKGKATFEPWNDDTTSSEKHRPREFLPSTMENDLYDKIDDEVQLLTLDETPGKSSSQKRSASQVKYLDNSDELFKSNPRKRRCQRSKQHITLSEEY